VVVATVGAQRTARPTFRFMERFDFLLTAHGTVSWLAWRSRPRPPSPAASSPGVSPPGSASSETLDELAGVPQRNACATGRFEGRSKNVEE